MDGTEQNRHCDAQAAADIHNPFWQSRLKRNMTIAQFRQIALSMSGAEERSHMGHPDFRVNGKIFASVADPKKDLAMVKVTLNQQASYLHTDPDTFYAASGAWGRSGCTMIRLQSADPEKIGEAMTAAWQAIVKKTKPAKSEF